MVENPEGFHFDDLQLQTHADNDIEALVSLANMDGEKVEFNATGQGSVEAIFNAIDKFFNQSVRLVSYTIDAVTDGIDAQDRVLVTVENRDTETIFNAAGLDFDVLKASAIAYINANTFVQKRMQVRWDAVFLTMICLVCKGEGYGKENSSSSRRRNWPRNHGGWFRSSGGSS